MSKRYSPEFKAKVVRAALDEYRSYDEISEYYGVPQGTFGSWIGQERALRKQQAEAARKAEEARDAASPAVSATVVAALESQNKILSEALGEIGQIVIEAHNKLST